MLDRFVCQEFTFSTVCPRFLLFYQCCVIILLSTVDGGLSVPRIIINQLKWLDRVVDSKVVISVTTGGLRFRSDG